MSRFVSEFWLSKQYDRTYFSDTLYACENSGVGTLFRMDESVEMEGRWENGKLSDPEGEYQYQDYPHYVKFYEQEVERAVGNFTTNLPNVPPIDPNCPKS